MGNPYGYQLLVDDAELDATVFVETVRRAQERLDVDPRGASESLRAALHMWRGPAFGGDAGGALSRAAAVRYEEYRIRAMELFFDSELALGNHTRVLGELREAHAENPLRERFCEQLMIALYRSGRQAEALETYRHMWSRLTEDLGIEPSPCCAGPSARSWSTPRSWTSPAWPRPTTAYPRGRADADVRR
ncbi:AfsR/SARP family transcriptional regulator [Streptomyces sp. M19]